MNSTAPRPPARSRGDGARDHRRDHGDVCQQPVRPAPGAPLPRSPEGACGPSGPAATTTGTATTRDRSGGAAVGGEADHVRQVSQQERRESGDGPVGGEHQEHVAGEREREGDDEPGPLVGVGRIDVSATPIRAVSVPGLHTYSRRSIPRATARRVWGRPAAAPPHPRPRRRDPLSSQESSARACCAHGESRRPSRLSSRG